MAPSGINRPNFTIIVNWKEKGFGCAKACSYCNWRTSPLLPHGMQSEDAISAFIRQCKKSFVTISGGGDPLYRFEENHPKLRSMAGIIKEQGFKVRIITREVQHVSKLKGIADYVSISLDEDVFESIDNYRHEWNDARIDIEYSLVLPPLPPPRLVALKPQYDALHKRLGRRLVLRENFNSIFPLDPATMSFGHRGIVVVPKSLCLDGRYLSTVDCTGHDIVQDSAVLAEYLMNQSDVYLFGGFVKHLIDPVVHLEYTDIDVIATDPGVMDTLAEKFAYSFKEVSPTGGYPRYFLGTSARAGKPIQLVLMNSDVDAKRFIFNSQYTVDRAGYNRGLIFDPNIGEAAIRHAVRNKIAQLVPEPRQMDLFHPERHLIEQRHRLKLLKKGFAVPAVSS